MEWVYINPEEDNEPTVFEGDGLRVVTRDGRDLETVSTVSDEPEVFGDEVVDDELLTPEEAFSKLARQLRNDADMKVKTARRAGGHVVVGESRAARIDRIRRELDALTKEATGDADMNLFKSLRAQLNALEVFKPSVGGDKQVIVEEPSDSGGGGGGGEGKTVVKVYDAGVGRILALERRVAALERVVGPSLHVDAEGASVTALVLAVREKLALLDEGAGERLRRDADAVASALRGVAASETVKAGVVMAKMSEWENVAASLPAVVERLRSLKRIHDEAGGFVAALRNLSLQYQELKNAAKDNRAVLDAATQNMTANLNTMANNVALLEKRLDRIQKRN